MQTKSIGLLLLCAAALLPAGAQAGTVTYTIENISSGPPQAKRYYFAFSGIQLQANQEIDILFDPAVYASLSNGFPGPGSDFDLLILQPNNPVGTAGHYGLMAVKNVTSILGRFSVDFTLHHGAQTGPLPYVINQYSDTGQFLVEIGTGTVNLNGVPEPGTFLSCAAVLVAGLARWLRTRRQTGA